MAEKLLEQTVGFIGAGNMAQAIQKGILTAGLTVAEKTILTDVRVDFAHQIADLTGAEFAPDNRTLVQQSDIVIFAVKPYQVKEVCAEIAPVVDVKRHLFVSICAGVKTSGLEANLPEGARVVRVMPNTPALIGCGSAGIAGGAHAGADDVELVARLFRAVGVAVILAEEKLDLVTGLTGSGPAYVFRFMEALIAAGVRQGLTAEEAGMLVPAMVLGSARMAVESGRELADLRQAVTTKGGTTEAGLNTLTEGGFDELVDRCVESASRRSRELS